MIKCIELGLAVIKMPPKRSKECSRKEDDKEDEGGEDDEDKEVEEEERGKEEEGPRKGSVIKRWR